MALENQPQPQARCIGQDDPLGEHTWKMFYPRRDFYFRECINCNRKQYYVDENSWYDIETKSYIDKKGIHSLKDMDGYEE